MSLKVCTGAHMLSTVQGTGLAKSWFPGIVDEALLESTKDGPIERAPDPVTMIEGDLYWINGGTDPITATVLVQRAPRTVLTTDPNTVLISDAWSWVINASPQAETPSSTSDHAGGKMQTNRASVSGSDLAYGRFVLEMDASEAVQPVGVIEPGDALHFRYVAAAHTPGLWIQNDEPDADPRFEAFAYYTRLLLHATPGGI